MAANNNIILHKGLRKLYTIDQEISKIKETLKQLESDKSQLINTVTSLDVFDKDTTEFTDGAFLLSKKVTSSRKINKEEFKNRFGIDVAFHVATIPVGEAEAYVGKNQLTGTLIEYVDKTSYKITKI